MPVANAEVVEFLRDCPLVFGLDDAGLEEVASLCTMVTFDAREQLFAEGEIDNVLWILMTGRVRLYHSDPEGRQLVVGFPAPHIPLDLAALDGRPHTVGATALEFCRVLLISQAARVIIARRFPATVVNTMRQLSRDLRQRDISHTVLSFRSARGRICCTLVQLAEQYGVRQSTGVKINFRLTRQDLADRSGVTLETSIRVVSDLQRRGVIATKSRVIEIIDSGELEEWSGCRECELDCTVFAKPTVADAPFPAPAPLARAPQRLASPVR
ncbi:MAG: Crp/Fnr family transcriptional regulator [Thermoflexaceae bacterium]|nr:Crp/Fnr family transcriptional regulator [Thermoflexaceae bacterium]